MSTPWAGASESQPTEHDETEPVEAVEADVDIDRVDDTDDDDDQTPAEPAVLGVEQTPSQGALPLDVKTGDHRVDEAVASLRELDGLPVSEHAEIFTQVHRDLQDALLTLDQG